MGQQVNFYSKLKSLDWGIAKASSKTHWIIEIRPETKWSSHEQVEDMVTHIGGLNPYM